LHALLIGIDHYLRGRLADGSSYYPSLRGSVRDIQHVREFLVTQLQLPADRIRMLSASNPVSPTQDQSPEPPDEWPTYENMVAALQHLTDECDPGEQVYVHYSGHGGRAPTLVPDRKGPNGQDEALVPTDIHRSGARYLRDIELALIFQRMVERGLHLTVVLDSCHSGGAVRGVGDVGVRGIEIVDRTPRPNHSLVASIQQLGQTWQQLLPTKRAVSVGSGWLPEPRGYTVLAACTDSESAFEYAFDGKELNGALTYWLLDTLRTYGTDLSVRAVYDRILAKTHSQFQGQTPQLEGDARQTLFGVGVASQRASVTVLEVDASRRRLRLGLGQALGARKGAILMIYPFGTANFEDPKVCQAVVTLVEVGAASSWAEITTTLREVPIEPGAPAVLVDPGGTRQRRRVGFVDRDQVGPFEAVRQAMGASPWLAEATPDDTLDYQVAVNERGDYELWDPAGQPIQNINPPLPTRDARSAATLVARLVHLAKYHTVQQLTNYDALSHLNGKLVVELLGLQEEYDPADRPDPKPFGDRGSAPVVPIGWWTFLLIRNQSTRTLNVSVLDLQPDWGIHQIWPSGEGDLFTELDPGQELKIPLRAALPVGYTRGRDQLKVFATRAPVDFHLLELSALDQPPASRAIATRGAPRGAPNPLEELLAALVADPPPGTPVLRTFSTASTAGSDWTTAGVEVLIQSSA
jgi:hypothetical protein